MYAALNQRRASVIPVAVMVVLAAGSGSTSFGDEPKPPVEKARLSPLDERYQKVVAGVLKIKEADVVILLGPPHTMKRPVAKELGRLPADLELGWELTTQITTQYKDGKVREVSGVFAEYLPVERVTPDNFHRVKVGMTQKEVVDILGDSYATLTVGDGVSNQWGATYSITLYFDKNGLLVSQKRLGHSYGPRKK
jgi:hypothetical protein